MIRTLNVLGELMVLGRDETHVALLVVGDLPCCLNLLAVTALTCKSSLQSMDCFESGTEVTLLHGLTALLVFDQQQALARPCMTYDANTCKDATRKSGAPANQAASQKRRQRGGEKGDWLVLTLSL